MDNLNLISNFAEFKELKNIDKSTMIGVLEDVFHALQNSTRRTRISTSSSTREGDLEIWRNQAPSSRTAPSRIPIRRSPCRSQGHRPDLRDRRRICRQIKLASFGRRAVLSLRQNLARASRPGEGQPTRNIREGRRDCHRRSLPGVEKGGADPRRRGTKRSCPRRSRFPTTLPQGDTIKAIVKSVE